MGISKIKYGVFYLFIFIFIFYFLFFIISDEKFYQFIFQEIEEKHRKIDLISRFKYA